MSLYVNRLRYGYSAPTIGASSGIVNNGYYKGKSLYDDDYVPPPPVHDYSLDYFTIESLENNNTITFNKGSNASSLTHYYSTNGGTSWSSYNKTNSFLLNEGSKILFKANNSAYARTNLLSYCWYFSSTKKFIVYGNIMSLLYSDSFADKITLTSQYTFSYLFNEASKLVNASNLILPATTLTTRCYSEMFRRCTSLTESPILPAATLSATCCYQNMFLNCSALNKVTCLATDIISASSPTSTWLSGVSANGTFYKDSSMSSWPSGADGIPSGWTVQDYIE